ncbi:Helix-turn-helix domain-containing protein [Amphibacillus marinus]|uniref:Helix-turn-helix domain-containing protein n=1 Tax=Amphibacillus marinus TaxID=872970 RepID=A0A1H8TI63_9BACI|nr:helix-turn-helix transcriptional regulator [Amphibacillus marinus]SEO90486.1 Helix-turn-helix domain-containing protein [Amphibacillus marinus]
MMDTIGDRFKDLRKRNNLKQIDFCMEVGISQGTLSDIEKGKNKPSIDTVISTSNKFHISTDWLLKGE